jgi:signal transduction histidine kinase
MTNADKPSERRDAVSSILHQIRSPLSALIMFNESVRNDLKSGDVQKLLKNLPDRLDRMRKQADEMVMLLNLLGEEIKLLENGAGESS